MKRFLIAILAATIGLTVVIPDAEAARRLGGGKSIGMNRDAGAMKQATPPTAAGAPAQNAIPGQAAAPAAAAQRSGMGRWMGPIAGLAAGLGIAALMSHLGLGEAFGNFLMIALLAVAVLAVVGLFLRRRQAASAAPLQFAGAGNAGQIPQPYEPRLDATQVGAGATAGAAGGGSIPAGFDVDGFLRQAKVNFLRLQAANDRGDMDDLKQFVSPEVFAEVRLQFDERGRTTQHTDVTELNVALLDLTEEAERHVASVRFHGQLREDGSPVPESFDELWHLTKARNAGWLVAGIQQFQ